MEEIADQVRSIPEDATLFRQTRWRAMEILLRQQLLPIDQQFHRDILRAAEDIPRQMRAAESWMIENARQNIRDGVPAEDADWPYQRVDENSPLPPAALRARGYGEIVQFPGVAAQVGAAPAGQPYFATVQLLQVAEDTKVMGRRMDQLFTPLSELGLINPPIPPRIKPNVEYGSQFIRRNIQIIDSVVKRGFLLSETNEEIARNLLREAGARTRSEALTIARTAVQQQATDAQDKFWNANRSVIGGWEYDSTMDFRVCPICAPWDGRTARKRGDLPTVPRHPRCRCVVLPLTETEIRLREKDGPQRRTVQELVPADQEKPPGAYAKKVTVDGKRYWRVPRELSPRNNGPITMGEWLAVTNGPTLRSVLGAGPADEFRKLSKTMSPDEALVRATMPVRERPSVKKLGAPKLSKSKSPRTPLNAKTKFR